MKNVFTLRTALPLVLMAGVPAVEAAPAANSPYDTDVQSSYVQDATSESIGQVNMIACIMHGLRPDALVNQDPYIALVDKNKCDAQKSAGADSGTAAGASQAPNYMTAVVVSTRASNSDPMIAKAWLSFTENGNPVTVFAHISATEAPSDANPYGTFRLDYCGKAGDGSGGGACMMNGFMQGGSGTLSYYEEDSNGGNGSQTTALKLTSVGTTSGSGSLSLQDSQNGASAFNFAYDQTYFLRQDPQGAAQCFARSAQDPGTGFSVWQYGLYDSATGEHIDRNSGFPIQYSNGGVTYQGFLGYYGLSLPPAAMATIATGSTLQKVDYNNNGAATASYSAVINGGRLVRNTRKSRTLKSLDQIHFNAWVSFSAAGLPDTNTQYEVYWDDASGKFVATAEMRCDGPGGCQTIPLTPGPVSLDPSLWASSGGVQGWSQSVGGDLFVDLHGVSGAVDSLNTTVVYHVQDLVYPDDANKPATLYCVNNCPTSATLQAYFTQPQGGNVQSPFVTATNGNFQPVQAGGVVTYTVDANAVLTGGDGASGSSGAVFTDANAYQQFPMFQNGVMSGRLFANMTDAQCGSNPAQYCDWSVNNAEVYYQWQTGPGSWNQFSAVKDNSGAFVHFDPPLQVSFHVPSGAAYGSYQGATLTLQYANFGNLWGIPGTCVSATTNAPVADCSQPNTRFVPQFVIPYDTTDGVVVATDDNGGTTSYLVKWLQREIRFARKDPAVCTTAPENLQPPSNVQLPAQADLKDPSNSSSDVYMGTEPTVTTAPRVVDGDVKY